MFHTLSVHNLFRMKWFAYYLLKLSTIAMKILSKYKNKLTIFSKRFIIFQKIILLVFYVSQNVWENIPHWASSIEFSENNVWNCSISIWSEAMITLFLYNEGPRLKRVFKRLLLWHKEKKKKELNNKGFAIILRKEKIIIMYNNDTATSLKTSMLISVIFCWDIVI